MSSVRIQHRPIPRCPYCHENVSCGAQYQCEQCGADHHLACWQEKDGCSACDEGRSTRKPGELRWKHDPRTGGDYAEVPEGWQGSPLIRPEGAKGWVDHGCGVYTAPASVIEFDSSKTISPTPQAGSWRQSLLIWIAACAGAAPFLLIAAFPGPAILAITLAAVLLVTLLLSLWISPRNRQHQHRP